MGTMCLILLFNAALIFPVAKIFAFNMVENCPSTPNYHWPTNVVEPIEYRLELFLKPEDQIINGTANILIQIHKQTQIIYLHAHKAVKIYRDEAMIVLNDLKKNGTTEPEKPDEVFYCEKAQIVQITFYDLLRPGSYNLTLSFTTSTVNNKAFQRYPYTSKGNETRWIVTTVNIPIAARRIFPCWDQPDVRLSFNISIKHSMYNDILSNMPKEPKMPADENGMQWTYFGKTPPMAAYQVAIAVINDSFSNAKFDKYNITWHALEIKEIFIYAQDMIDKFIKALASYTEAQDIMPKTDYIVVPKFPIKIFKSPGLVIFREQNIKYVENKDFLGTKLKVLKFVGRHLASQLFNGNVGPYSWHYSWFNEALALYLSYYISSQVQKDQSIMDLYVVQILQPALHSEVTFNLKPIIHEVDYSDEIEMFLYSRLYHNKGSALIHMLHYISGPENFQKALRKYLKLFKHKAARIDVFWTILQSVLYENQTKIDPIIYRIMDKWLAYRGFPTFHVRRWFETSSALIIPNCNNTLCWDADISIPITYTSMSNLSDYNIEWVKCKKEFHVLEGLDKNCSILINVNQTGYYRVNYDKLSWKEISSYLNKKNYALLPVLNRAQIIDDAYYFLRTGDLNFELFTDVIRYLKQETNYIAWYPMFNILSTWSTFLQYQSDFIKPHILEILNSLLNKIGYEEYPEENNMRKALRLLATKWACKLGHEECREAATAKLAAELNGFQNRTEISPWWKDWIYCAGMMHLNESLFLQTAKLSIRNQDMEMLKYLTCSENATYLTRYMDLLLDAYIMKEFMDTKKMFALYYLIIKKHAEKDEILQFIFGNYDFLDMILYSSLREKELWTNIIMNIHSNEDENLSDIYSSDPISKVKQFLKGNSRGMTEATQNLTQRLLEAQANKRRVVLKTFTVFQKKQNATESRNR